MVSCSRPLWSTRARGTRRLISTNLDLIQAYSQVVMSGDKDAFIVIPNEVVQILPTDWRDKFAALRRFVKKATRGVYGIGRVGSDSSETFAGWLAVDRIINNPVSRAMWLVGKAALSANLLGKLNSVRSILVSEGPM